MHLLYLDDSGSANNSTEEYLVLGGVAVYEAQVDWVTRRLDEVAATIDPEAPHSIEFHASEIFSRRAPPRSHLSRNEARGTVKAVLMVLAESYETARAIACAVHKRSFPGRDPMELAFEELCSRFDLHLSRLRSAGDRQRGLLILDRSTRETSLQAMAREFRTLGTRWGVIRNLADTPMFIDSAASRVVQPADHVAHAVFRRYEAGDTQYFDLIAQKFDSSEGVVHGLVHRQKSNPRGMCLACASRSGGRDRIR